MKKPLEMAAYDDGSLDRMGRGLFWAGFVVGFFAGFMSAPIIITIARGQ